MKKASQLLLILFVIALENSPLAVFSFSAPAPPPSEDPLVRACEQRDVQKADQLLKNGADPNVIDKKSGRTPLIAASLVGNLDIVRSLLRAGANVNQIDPNGENALIAALGSSGIHPGSEDVALLLILWGADIKHKSSGSWTAFLSAAWGGRNTALVVLKEKGANVNDMGWNNRTALHMAAIGESPTILPILLDWGLDINAQDDEGMTPLMYAVVCANSDTDSCTARGCASLDTVKLLLDSGADCHLTNKEGQTTLDLAKGTRAHSIISLIEARCGSKK